MPATPVKLELAADAFEKLPPVPLTMLQLPVPTLGVLAASVVLLLPQIVCAVPASAVLGFLGKAIMSESADEAHGALEMVQNNT